jgi:thioredoxin reductase
MPILTACTSFTGSEFKSMTYDAIIVGGSYAGLAAAMHLARARRNVLIVDGGQRRNRFADRSHGFFTRDGEAAAAIVAKGRQEVLAYATVRWIDGLVRSAERAASGFELQIEGMATSQQARRLVLATGVTDVLPDLPGLSERWGRHVLHCPYCHGFELEQGPVGVLATSALSMHQALMLPDWGPTTFFLNGSFQPDEAQLAQLRARGVTLEYGLVDRLQGAADLVLKDGRVSALAGLFTFPKSEPAGALAAQLGCEFEDHPLGRMIKTDPRKATTVAGVFACGDVARVGGSVTFSVADGAMAGVAAHQSLIFDSY